MKKISQNKIAMMLSVLSAFALFQGCEAYVGHGSHPDPDWGWHHGGWHHGDDDWHHGGDHDGWHHGGHHFERASVNQLASDFGIRTESAKTILNITHGNLDDQKIANLNLDQADVMAIAQYQMPSRNAIDQMAKALGEDSSKIEKIAQSFVTDVQAQVSDVTSEYWQSCMSSGHWKTPQNSYCAKTFWSGCSPTSGATACESVQ